MIDLAIRIKGETAMIFIVFVLLFTILCGWLDIRVDAKKGEK
jgi:hypothetical protein